MDSYIPLTPTILLYAETHFKFFRLFPSILFRRMPEILFDMPRRIAPGQTIPLLMLINDIDKYHVDLKHVTISISQNGLSWVAKHTDDLQLIRHPLEKQNRAYLFSIPDDRLKPGSFHVNATITLQRGTKTVVVLNDNLHSSSKLGFQCYFADEELPGAESALYGDLHVHSNYTESHVEFGAPLSVIETMAQTYGIDCVGIVDHSYDLTCAMDDYRTIDPTRARWFAYQNEFNAGAGSLPHLIRGEEVSCRNHDKRIVHLGGLQVSEYIPGSGDGARRNSNKENELTIPEAISEIHRQGGIAFAAHPGSHARWLQKTFLRRGVWSSADLIDSLDAFQAVNSGFSSTTWLRARKLWVEYLLKGNKLSLIGGNDAHGDFNRYRAIEIPFISIREDFNRYFAFARTGIYSRNTSVDNVLHCIKDGKTFITNGPFLAISSSENSADCLVSKTQISCEANHLFALIRSSYEFGYIRELRIFHGNYRLQHERLILHKHYDKNAVTIIEPIPATTIETGYIRAEAVCIQTNGATTMAATSPCYIGG
jgi:hypothetical protein